MKYEIETPFFVERLKARDAEALKQVIEEYTTDLFKMGKVMRLTHEKIDDAIQETYISFQRKIHDFKGHSKIKTFLIGIFINKAREAYRFADKGNSNKIEEILNKNFGPNGHWLQEASPSEPELLHLKKEQLELLNSCLATSLNNMQREVIALKMEQEISNEEICNILSISNTNLRQIIFRAKHALRICVEEKNK